MAFFNVHAPVIIIVFPFSWTLNRSSTFKIDWKDNDNDGSMDIKRSQ